MLGGDVLLDGVFVGMHDVEAGAIRMLGEKARDRVPEHETILPAMRGGRRFQEDDLDSGAAKRGLVHRPAQRVDAVPAPDHLARGFEHVALHAADGTEGADDVEEVQTRGALPLARRRAHGRASSRQAG